MDILEQARNGDAAAQNILGNYFYKKQSYKEAAIWWKKAGKQNNLEACLSLGYLYLYGLGIEENTKNAFQLFEYASSNNNPAGMNALGMMFLKGKGCTQNEFQAYMLFTEASKKGNKVAPYYLGNMYEEGLFVKKDTKKAKEYYELSYERGYKKAIEKIKAAV